MIGDRLGPYTVRTAIGRGGMGTVYRALADDGDEAALKVMGLELGSDSEAVERFQREAELLSALDHPNVVRIIHPLEEVGERLYYAMELVRGPSVATLLRERGRLTPGEAAALVLRVLDALGAAHEQGVIHRDVKPSNVLVGAGAVVKVCDFGLARVAVQTRLTRDGRILGTPAYISPEQADGVPADHRTDLYSAGVMLYECLAGRPPFVADVPLAVLRMHIEREPPPLGVTPLPPGLEDVVLRALAKQPDDRFESARAFADAIEALGVFGPTDGDRGAALLSGLVAEDVTQELATDPSPARLGLTSTPRGGSSGGLLRSPGGGIARGSSGGFGNTTASGRGRAGASLEPARSRVRIATIAMALLLLAALLAAGVALQPAGHPVRLHLTGRPAPVEARLVRLDDAFAVIEHPDGSRERLPRTRIERIDYE